MKSEKEIRMLLEGMYKHQKYIKDDFQRFGFDNFKSALEYVLDDNQVLNTQLEARADELGLRVGYVKLGDRVVDIDGRRICLKER